MSQDHPETTQLLLLADGELADADVAAHVAGCAACAATVAALRGEGAALGAALRDADAALADSVTIPPFRRPASLRGFAVANVAVGLAIWLPQFLWKTLFGELVVEGTSWVTATWFPDTWDLASRTALNLLNQGTAMIETYLVLVAAAVVAALGLWLVLFQRVQRSRRSLAANPARHLGVLVLAGAVGVGAVGAPAPADALEVRRSEGDVVIAADETIDDTLVVAGQRVVVAGTVTGDLIAVGEDVAVEGAVGGNIVTFARVIRVTGTVGGSLLGAGERLDLDGVGLDGDLWVAGNRIELRGASRVGRNVALAAESALVAAPVARTVYAAGERIELAAEVGGDLEVAGRTLDLAAGARVRGDARLRLPGEDHLRLADGAVIDGEVAFLRAPRELDRRPNWLRPGHWAWLLVGFIGSVLVGLALLWLFPGLRQLAIPGGVEGVKTAGIGLVAIVSLPVLAGLAAITLVGLPFGLFGIAAWVALLYLAKVVVGIVLGRLALASTAQRDNTLLVVLVGMLLVTIAANIPWIGGVIGAVLTVVGAGLLVERLLAQLSQMQEARSA